MCLAEGLTNKLTFLYSGMLAIFRSNADKVPKAQKEQKSELEYETRKVPTDCIEDIVSDFS